MAVIIKRSKKSYNEGKKLAEKNNNLIKDSIGKNTNDQKNIQILNMPWQLLHVLRVFI